MLVHHAGKDPTRGARGWSGLRAAADAEIEVTRTPLGRTLHNSKQTDGGDGGRWGFRLEPITIGIDEDGDPIDSGVCIESDVPADSAAPVVGRKRGVWADQLTIANRYLVPASPLHLEACLTYSHSATPTRAFHQNA